MTLHFQKHGQGPAVVLLHGLFGSLENLGIVRRTLEKHFTVYSIDLPDHGRSPRTTKFAYDNYTRLVMETIDKCNLQSVDIVGHSMGGKIAMCLALLAPQRVNKLVVADIAPVKYEHRHRNVLNGLAHTRLGNISGRKEAEQQLAEHIREPGVRQFLLKSLTKTEQGQWQWLFNHELIARDYHLLSLGLEADNSFSGDTLFIKGANSDYLLPEHRPAIAKLFPNAQAKVLQGTGHWLHAEKPEQFNRILLRFLQGS